MPTNAPANNDNFPSYQVEQRTVDATPIAILSIPTYPNGCYQIKAYINAKKPTTMDCGGWEITGTFKNINNVLTLIGSLDIIGNADATLSATLVVSSAPQATFIQVQVTGIASSNVIWTGTVQVSRLQLAN